MKTAITDFGLQVNFIEQAHLPTENLGIMRLKCTSLCAFLGTLLSWLSNYLTGHFSSFLYWFFVLFLNSTMFGEYCSSVLGLILFFFIDIHTLFSVPVDDLSQYFNCHLSAVDSNFHLQPIPISSTSASHFQLIIWYPLWCLIGMSDLCLNQNTWYLLQICSSVTCPHL